MNRLHIGLPSGIRVAASVATAFALTLGLLAPALAAGTATFSGTVLAPGNGSASGFTVAFKDVGNGREFRSDPTGTAGTYRVTVPAGAHYRLNSVVAPDGTMLAVQNVPPVSVQPAGTKRIDIRFAGAESPALAPGAAAADDDKKKKKSAAPWWKQPGPIVGLVLGSLALAAVAAEVVDDTSSTPAASPSTPPPSN
jgi:type 1 fimbria pilin